MPNTKPMMANGIAPNKTPHSSRMQASNNPNNPNALVNGANRLTIKQSTDIVIKVLHL